MQQQASLSPSTQKAPLVPSPAVQAPVQQEPVLLPSARLFEAGWLPRILRTRDLFLFCLVAVLLVTNVPLVAGAGGASMIYWILGFLMFLIPSTLIAAQLFRLFPGEAAVYQWTNRALGNFWDSFVGFFCNWWPGGAVGLTVEAGAVVSSIQMINANWLSLPWQQGLAELGVLLVAQLLCFLPQHLLKQCLKVIVLCYLFMMFLLGWAGITWLISGHPIQGDVSAQGWQIHPEQYPIFATVILALLGVAIPLNVGAEIMHRHAANRALFWGVIVIMVGYLISTLGVLVVLPPKDLTNPSFMSEIFTLAFGPAIGGFLGLLNALVMITYFLFAATVYNQLFSRFLLTASIDRRLPATFAQLSQRGVPMNAMIAQTIINSGFIIMVFFLAPIFAPSNQHFSFVVFLVVMNGAAVVWNVAMIGLFLSGIVLFLRHPGQLAACKLVPNWILHTAAVVGIIASLVAIYSVFFAGSPVPDTLNNQEWGFWVLLIVLGSMAIGAVYSYLVPEAEDLAALLRTHKSLKSAK
jgi:amino acid transporter